MYFVQVGIKQETTSTEVPRLNNCATSAGQKTNEKRNRICSNNYSLSDIQVFPNMHDIFYDQKDTRLNGKRTNNY